MQIELKENFKWFLTEEFRNLREGFFLPTDNNDNGNNDNDSSSGKNDEKLSITKGENFFPEVSSSAADTTGVGIVEEHGKEKTSLSNTENIKENLQGSMSNKDDKFQEESSRTLKNYSPNDMTQTSYVSDTKPKQSATITGSSEPNKTFADFQPVILPEDFFYTDKPLPAHNLETSPCYPIIAKTLDGFYYCTLHPNEIAICLDTIELQHCRLKDPGLHFVEIQKRLGLNSQEKN